MLSFLFLDMWKVPFYSSYLKGEFPRGRQFSATLELAGVCPNVLQSFNEWKWGHQRRVTFASPMTHLLFPLSSWCSQMHFPQGWWEKKAKKIEEGSCRDWIFHPWWEHRLDEQRGSRMGISKGSLWQPEHEDVMGGEGQWRATAESLGVYRVNFEDLVSLSTSTIIKKVNNVVSKGGRVIKIQFRSLKSPSSKVLPKL